MSILGWRKLLIVMVLFGWGSQIIYLYPTPPQSIQSWYEYATQNPESYIWKDFSPSNDSSESTKRRYIADKYGPKIWARWIFLLILVIAGLLAIVLISARMRAGAIGLIVLSGMYYLFWATQPGGLMIDWLARLAFAREQGGEILFLHRQLLLPTMFLIICVVSVIILLKSKNSKG